MDVAGVINECLQHFYIQQNKALADECSSLAEAVSDRNRTISNLSAIIAELRRRLRESQVIHIRRIVDENGHTAYFSRGLDGVFRELDVLTDEPVRNVRRRLDFDSDSDSDIEDEFTRELFDV